MNGKRVLLVEDDPAIRQLVTDLLTDLGHLVVPASSGREGLALVEGARPDVIILDKLMSDGDGTMFAMAYREMPGARAPIIAFCAARDGLEWASSIGAAGFVVKPFDIDVLLAAVQEQLGGGPSAPPP